MISATAQHEMERHSQHRHEGKQPDELTDPWRCTAPGHRTRRAAARGRARRRWEQQSASLGQSKLRFRPAETGKGDAHVREGVGSHDEGSEVDEGRSLGFGGGWWVEGEREREMERQRLWDVPRPGTGQSSPELATSSNGRADRIQTKDCQETSHGITCAPTVTVKYVPPDSLELESISHQTQARDPPRPTCRALPPT